MKTATLILRYALLIIFAYCISTLFEVQLIGLYKFIFPNSGGGFIDFTGLVVFFYSMEFLIPFLMLIFGSVRRYWAAGVLSLGMLIFEYWSDHFNFLNPLVLVVAGLVLGELIRRFVSATLGKIPTFESYKKYF